MADQNDGADKTEQPTPRKLQDARKKGNIAKSKDVTSTTELLVWLALASLGLSWATLALMGLITAGLDAIGQPFGPSAAVLGRQAWQTLLAITALALLPVAAVGVITEFLQAGPVFATDKLKPRMAHLNPVDGIKRMFSLDNLAELLKSMAKTALLGLVGWLVATSLWPQLPWLASAAAPTVRTALWEVSRQTLGWTAALFVLVSVLDAAWQRHRFLKKMRMSRRDLKQEAKDAEGDPLMRQQRQQIHQEWSQQLAAQAAQQAHVLVVNPTHVAIAIDYDRETCPVPTVRAKGEDHVARAMREAAEAAGVPILRNVGLARTLLAEGREGELVPPELFDIVAEVILWSREVREEIQRQREGRASERSAGTWRPAPGEDLSRYPLDTILAPQGLRP
jgi:type III secretion protein U